MRIEIIALGSLLMSVLLFQGVNAQTDRPTPVPAAQGTSAGQDKSGTNPLVLTYSAGVTYEYYDLPVDGINNHIAKFRFAVPFGKGNQFDIRLPITATNTSIGFLTGGSDGPVGIPPIGISPGDTKGGLGDLTLRFTRILFVSPKRKIGAAAQLELGFDTATRAVLGTGKNTIAPSFTLVSFPLKKTIFAPTYKQVNSYSGKDFRAGINQGVVDLYLVRSFNKGRNNITLDPQIIFDYKNKRIASALETNFGFVLSQEKGLVYTIGFGFPIGGNRPYDFKFKTGFAKNW